jgi:cytochrome P450
MDELDRRRHRADPGSPADVLSVLVDAVDEDGRPLSDVEICDELVTLLIAGHETTSTALAWAFERILRDQTVSSRLRASFADENGAYLDAVVEEVLRIRPPLIDAMRMLSTTTEIGGYRLARGTLVMVAIPLVDRNAAPGLDHDQLRPDGVSGRRSGPYAWIPFGGGVRRCIGASLATMEIKTVLATVLERAELRPDRPEPEQARLFGTALVPSRGGSVVLQHRLP